MLTISPREFELIFGITSGDKEFEMKKYPIHETTFGEMRFAVRRNKKVTATNMRDQLEICVQGSEQNDIEDIVRISINFVSMLVAGWVSAYDWFRAVRGLQ